MLCNQKWLQTHNDPPASASQVLELQAEAAIPTSKLFLLSGILHLSQGTRVTNNSYLALTCINVAGFKMLKSRTYGKERGVKNPCHRSLIFAYIRNPESSFI